MKLDIANLGYMLEHGKYINEGKVYSIEEGKKYFLQTEGVDFNCQVILDEDGDISISEINGEKPNGYEYFYSVGLEDSFSTEEVIKDLATEYKYVASLEDSDMLLYLPENNISYNGSLYEGGIMLGYEKMLLCHESNDHYTARAKLGIEEESYDIVEEVYFEDILDIDFSTIKDKILLDIFTKRGTISIVSNLESDPDLDNREIFREIKKFLI